MFWILLLALGGVALYAVVRLRAIEAEIRAEMSQLPAVEQHAPAPVSSAPPESSAKAPSTPSPVEPEPAESAGSLQIKLLKLVMQQPGIAQTEVYRQFSADQRREIQDILRRLDQQKMLRREKKGNSYTLYPVG